MAARLAHELKNPLFPLQITARTCSGARPLPRIVRRSFPRRLRTLLAELANLKQIVGRFSDFAKMPAPKCSR